MKWLTLLVLVVFAEGSNNHRDNSKAYDEQEDSRESKEYRKSEEKDDCIDPSEMKINRTLMAQEYNAGALTFPAPSIENGDCGGQRFKEQFGTVGIRWGQEINNNIYHQAVAVGHDLIDKINERFRDLSNSIEGSLMNGLDDSYVEKDLRLLVAQLWTFLELKPGRGKIKHRPLHELPPLPRKVISQTKNRTATEIFLHLPEFFDEDYSAIYGFVSGIFLAGWQNTRKYFDLQQTQYRNEILNKIVMFYYRKAVEKVYKHSEYIQGCVKKETWKDFDCAGTRIVKISSEWQGTLNISQDDNEQS